MSMRRVFAKGDIIVVRKNVRRELAMAKNSLAFYQIKLPNKYRVKVADECCGHPSLVIEPIMKEEILSAHIEYEQGCIREAYFIKAGEKE